MRTVRFQTCGVINLPGIICRIAQRLRNDATLSIGVVREREQLGYIESSLIIAVHLPLRN